jgi:hypothetical protein
MSALLEADPIDARIEELMAHGWDWHSAYLRAKIEDHRDRALSAQEGKNNG